MKRQWAFDHIVTKKSIKLASADVGFIFIAYNLRRIINIIGIDKLLETFNRFRSLWAHNTSKNLHKVHFAILCLLNLLSFLNSRCRTLLHFLYFYPKYENVGWFLDGLPLAAMKTKL
ncbi:MAG: hypothetical protein ACJAQR_000646 [Bacteroidia bacterium]|jgi:hypothetical protein